MELSLPQVQKLKARHHGLKQLRQEWESTWRDLSKYFLPQNYYWLPQSGQGTKQERFGRNRDLLNSTSVQALQTLTTGMMNGVTSPSRPWFTLSLSEFDESQVPHEISVWLEQSTQTLRSIIAQTNFYRSLMQLYADLVCFGTASMEIAPDPETVFRCYNHSIGEFAIGMDQRGRLDQHAREFEWTVAQTVSEFGLENVSQTVKNAFEKGDDGLLQAVHISCLAEVNSDPTPIRKSAPYRITYWEEDGKANSNPVNAHVLRVSPLEALPVCPRWEVQANNFYGTSPCMKARPAVVELQYMKLSTAQGLSKTIHPSMLVNSALRHSRKVFTPNGVTYVPGSDLRQGAAPVHTFNLPYDQLYTYTQTLVEEVQELLFNDLFKDIMRLSTVRSATEIDARQDEKLLLLGPILQRFEAEALDPCISRIFQIAQDAGVLPPLPEGDFGELALGVRYEGILADAQRAVATASTERFLAMTGQVAQLSPEAAKHIEAMIDWEELLRRYGKDINLPPSVLRSRDVTQERIAAMSEGEQTNQALEALPGVAGAAASLSQSEVQPGTNALQTLMGGVL